MRDETPEGLPEGSQNVSGDLQPIKMDPGSVGNGEMGDVSN